MIRSMTGFGKRAASAGSKSLSLEVKSLNSKQLDLNLRLPNVYRQREIEIRNMVAATLIRGKVDFTISYDNAAEMAAGQVINKDLFRAYFNELSALAGEYNLPTDDLIANILKLPGILQATDDSQLDEAEWNALKPAIQLALNDLDAFRIKEGSELLKDIIDRVSQISKLTEEIEKTEPQRVAKVKERLAAAVAELKEGQLDSNRLEQEIIFYIEKLDITEEIVRLKTHCAYMVEVMNEQEMEKGRKLAFISQEMGREINTIGSKANDAAMQRQVVLMKEQLEKIKEQMNNVL